MATLKELYKKYKVQSEAIVATVRQYEEIAMLMNVKHPSVAERKYVEVRKTETA